MTSFCKSISFSAYVRVPSTPRLWGLPPPRLERLRPTSLYRLLFGSFIENLAWCIETPSSSGLDNLFASSIDIIFPFSIEIHTGSSSDTLTLNSGIMESKDSPRFIYKETLRFVYRDSFGLVCRYTLPFHNRDSLWHWLIYRHSIRHVCSDCPGLIWSESFQIIFRGNLRIVFSSFVETDCCSSIQYPTLKKRLLSINSLSVSLHLLPFEMAQRLCGYLCKRFL